MKFPTTHWMYFYTLFLLVLLQEARVASGHPPANETVSCSVRSLWARRRRRSQERQNQDDQPTAQTTPIPTPSEEPPCADTYEDSLQCAHWAQSGECDTNSAFMHERCRRSCGLCRVPCVDDHAQCLAWAQAGECENNPGYMHHNCKRSCGLCTPSQAELAAEREAAREAARERCVDEHPTQKCRHWAWYGECDKNKDFMASQCRQTCGLCTPTEAETPPCQDYLDLCQEWATKGNGDVPNLCTADWSGHHNGLPFNGAYVIEMCPRSCKACDVHLDDRDIELGVGLPQSIDGMDTDKNLFNLIKSKVAEVVAYTQTITDKRVKRACKMSDPQCARYSAGGNCQTDPDRTEIKYDCAAACLNCEALREGDGLERAEKAWKKALRTFKKEKWNSTDRRRSRERPDRRRGSTETAVAPQELVQFSINAPAGVCQVIPYKGGAGENCGSRRPKRHCRLDPQREVTHKLLIVGSPFRVPCLAEHTKALAAILTILLVSSAPGGLPDGADQGTGSDPDDFDDEFDSYPFPFLVPVN